MAIVKPHDFAPSTLAESAKVDENFDIPYNLLNGTSTNQDQHTKFNHAANPVVRFDQLGAGPIAAFRQAGVDKLVIENNGKITNDNVLVLTKSWLYVILPAAVETVESQPRFIVPSVGLNTITRLYVVWAAGADSGASNIFTIKRRNAAGVLQADVGTVEVNTPAQNVVGDNNISDVPLTAGDQIYPLFTTRNTASEQMVTVAFELTVKLS